MAKKIRLGIKFGIDKQWIAGSYYLINLVHALNTLKNTDKPHIVFLTSYDNQKIIKSLNYPYFSIINPYALKRNYIEAAVNKLYKFFFKKDIIIKQLSDKQIDYLFPANFEKNFEQITNKIFWIPDFQHHYYPDFFSQEEINLRNTIFKQIANSDKTLVLSSENAENDFHKFYPKSKVKIAVIPFAVTHPDYSALSKETMFKKYNITKPYFIVTNQFWQHKNHIAVFKAIKILKEKHEKLNFEIVLTGRKDDYRAPQFFSELIQFIEKNNLSEDLNFVGFIDRKEQLFLMKNAIALVQPSLFEGWSTVVEDAKAMNQFIILSNIEVHKEQAKQNVHFFNPHKAKELADILLKFENQSPKIIKTDYTKKVKKFGLELINILK